MNPFIWSSRDFDNFLKLVINYDTINFRNIKCELIENQNIKSLSFHQKFKQKYVKILYC